MRYRMTADLVFEAEGLQDAYRRLAAHFLRTAMNPDEEKPAPWHEGRLEVAPALEEEETYS
ncbi:MAG: hypothetical protein ABI610_05715 [Acidobacteriota bacterium]